MIGLVIAKQECAVAIKVRRSPRAMPAVIAPSPLAGEGSAVSLQRELGEGVASQKYFFDEEAPSPNRMH
jgi:hypothetical protein